MRPWYWSARGHFLASECLVKFQMCDSVHTYPMHTSMCVCVCMWNSKTERSQFNLLPLSFETGPWNPQTWMDYLRSDNYLVSPDPVPALTFAPTWLHLQILCSVPSDASFNSQVCILPHQPLFPPGLSFFLISPNYLFQQSWKVLLSLVSFLARCMKLLQMDVA